MLPYFRLCKEWLDLRAAATVVPLSLRVSVVTNTSVRNSVRITLYKLMIVIYISVFCVSFSDCEHPLLLLLHISPILLRLIACVQCVGCPQSVMFAMVET